MHGSHGLSNAKVTQRKNSMTVAMDKSTKLLTFNNRSPSVL